MDYTVASRDTICSLATPPGIGGLAVVRVSGPNAFTVVDIYFSGSTSAETAISHTIHYGWWRSKETVVDSVTISVYRAPNSYTGENVVEVGCHGGRFVTDQILAMLTTAGARQSTSGEFTKRAFLNGKLDLTQAEAVADIIHAESVVGVQTAARQLAGGFTKGLAELRVRLLDVASLLELELDFSEEDLEFVDRTRLLSMLVEVADKVSALSSRAKSDEILRSGFFIAVAGYPNAGKSSLFNAVLQRDRAIVSAVPGTTRDYLEESIVLDGYTVHLADTAGIRASDDEIELGGIRFSYSLIEQSNLVLIVNDASLGCSYSSGLQGELAHRFPYLDVLVVQNKIDLVDQTSETVEPGDIMISAKTGYGLNALRISILDRIKKSTSSTSDVLLNNRQSALLQEICVSIESALSSLRTGLPGDLLAVDVRTSIRLLGELSGETWNPEILDGVFSRFCIGK